VTAVLADAHLHLFSRGFPGRGGRAVLGLNPEVEAYEGLRSRHGIACALVVGYEADGIDPDNNAYILELASERPWMATLAFVPASPLPEPGLVAGQLEAGHRGIAVYASDEASAAAVAAWPPEIWGAVRDRAAIVSFNARPPAVPFLSDLVRRENEIAFLFSHLGLPGRHETVPTIPAARDRLASLLALSELDNVFVKISGLYAVSDPAHAYPHASARPFIDVILDGFCPDNCVWGSDFSVALEFVSFTQLLANPFLDRLNSDERDRVMGGNLLRLLRRDDLGSYMPP
jgi:L-fuconolactonase